MSRERPEREFRDPDTLSIGRSHVSNGEFAARRSEAEHGSAMLLLAINRLKQKMVRREMGV